MGNLNKRLPGRIVREHARSAGITYKAAEAQLGGAMSLEDIRAAARRMINSSASNLAGARPRGDLIGMIRSLWLGRQP